MFALVLLAFSLVPASYGADKFRAGHGDKYVMSIECKAGKGWGGDPQYIVIGTQKCGTSFFAHLIAAHPQVRKPKKKEVHFFDVHYEKGVDWYRNCFKNLTGTNFVTGEVTPDINYLPWAVKNLAQSYPNIKVFVLFCDPAQRAWSGLQMLRRWKVNFTEHDLAAMVPRVDSFIRQAKRELAPSALLWERPDIWCPPPFHLPCPEQNCGLNFECDGYSFLTRGLYAEQLRYIYRKFPKENVMVLESEKVFEGKEEYLRSIFKFLGLPMVKFRRPTKPVFAYRPTLVGNQTKRTQGYEMPSDRTVQILKRFYRTYNKDLITLWPDAKEAAWIW